ncbi:MAG TPA: DUF2127 domain-containing protein [Terriglobales bacterium]|nr:DUF2127 domain-containing protein [Terriglobales bacterium]
MTRRPLSPYEVQPNAHLKGLRSVAALEFLKGLAVLLLGFGLLSLVHRDVWEVAVNFLDLLRINPDHHYAQVFLNLADRLNDTRLWMMAAAAAAYSSLRFLEAYGLWKARAWGEWIALVSGTIYLPFEIYELARKPTPIRAAILLINVAVVLYMLYLRTWGRTGETRAYQAGD